MVGNGTDISIARWRSQVLRCRAVHTVDVAECEDPLRERSDRLWKELDVLPDDDRVRHNIRAIS